MLYERDTILSVKYTRYNFARLVRELRGDLAPREYLIANRGVPSVVLLTVERYEDLMERAGQA